MIHGKDDKDELQYDWVAEASLSFPPRQFEESFLEIEKDGCKLAANKSLKIDEDRKRFNLVAYQLSVRILTKLLTFKLKMDVLDRPIETA